MSEKQVYENGGLTYPRANYFCTQWKSETERREWFALHRPPQTPTFQQEPLSLCLWKVWSALWILTGFTLCFVQWMDRIILR